MKIVRPPVSIGHYKMVKHKGDKGNEENPHRWGAGSGWARGHPWVLRGVLGGAAG